MDSTTQALVKVSSCSHIKLNGIEAIRAVTLTDARAILASKRIDFVVFEELLPEEVEAIKALRNDFRVPMFTFGALVIEGIDNFVSLSDLQDSIEGTTGIWVRTYGVSRSPRLWDKQFDEFGNEVPILELEDKLKDVVAIEDVSDTELEETAEETTEGTATEQPIITESTEPTTDDERRLSEEVAQAELEVATAKAYKEVEATILSLKTELDYYRKTIKALETSGAVLEIEKLVSDCARFEKQIAELKTKPVIDEAYKAKQEEAIATLEETLRVSREQIAELQASNDVLQQQAEETGTKLKSSEKQLYDREEQLRLLRKTAYSLGLLATQYKSSAISEQEGKTGIFDKYSEALKEKGILTKDLNGKIAEIAELQRRANEAQRMNDLKFSDLDSKRVELQAKVSELEVHNSELSVSKIELEAQIADVQASLETTEHLNEDLHAQIEELTESLETATAEVQSLHSQLDSVSDTLKESKQSKDDLSISNQAILELQKEIGNLQIQIREEQRVSAEKDRKIGTLQKAKLDAERTAKTFSRSMAVGNDVNLTCAYNGKGYILPVFGSGSYGITTTAVSMAKKLHKEGSSVCLLDWDLVSPKVNSFFDKNPLMAQEYEGIDKMKCSCMGLLVEKGTAWFIDHREELLTTIEQNKKTGKRLDYFSGLYVPVETPKFVSIDYTELLNVLGNDYDYIVADLGKLGGSDSQNALIRLLNTVSLKTTLVCLKDKDDIRNLFLKTKYNKLDSKKFVWLLNMAPNTGVTDFMKNMFKLMPYRVMTFNNGMYGEHKTFGNALIKGMFDELVDELILNR